MSLTAPVAYQVILEPGIGQLPEFESPRVRTRTIFRGTFSCALIDLRKAQERELATLDENRRSVGAEPYAPKKMKAITGGGEGTTPVATACMSRSWKVEVCRKKKSLDEMINQ